MAQMVLIAPDKFKGSLTSFAVCEAVKKGLLRTDPSLEVLCFPMADGGDGFSLVMKHYCATETVQADTLDPLGRPIKASYEWEEASRTAIIELAAASGLVLLAPEERNPMQSSSEGTGHLIQHALRKGAEKIILGLGGSATNDAGMGILKALGFTLLDSEGREVEPVGKNLRHIQQIEAPTILPSLQWEIATDVNNPLHGPHGAAFVYAKQKGANADDILILDEGLRHIDHLLSAKASTAIGALPGTGAAGGIVAGLLPWFPLTIKSGIDLVLQKSGWAQVLPQASLVITGEGRVDEQTLHGKVVAKIAASAKALSIPVWVVCGSADLPIDQLKKNGISHVLTLEDPAHSKEYCVQHAAELIEERIAGGGRVEEV